MKAKIVYLIQDWAYGPGKVALRRLALLLTDERTEFKKSFLNQGDYNDYGDSSVVNWKMSGSVDPNIEDFQYPWSGSWHFTDGSYAIEGEYQFGTESSYYIEVVKRTSTGKFHDWKYLEVKLVGDSEIWSRKNRSNYDESQALTDWRLLATKRPDGSWKGLSSAWHQTWVNYDLRDPLPYYWIDYMREIRPWSAHDNEVLSEIIRNTISEETTLATNSYANLTEAIDIIQDFRNGKVIELIEDSKKWWKIVKNAITEPSSKNMKRLGKRVASDASSAWLQYRYAYSTTKSDVEQFTRQTLNNYLGKLTADRVLRGSSSISNGRMCVKMRLHDNTAPNLDYVLMGLDRYGLFPGLYNLWDMVPFSFIADWFSNLGDVLQDIDQRIYFKYYKVDELLVSTKQELKVQEPWGLTTYSWYERNSLTEMPQWEIYTEDPKSKKVWSCRAADAASIVTSVVTSGR